MNGLLHTDRLFQALLSAELPERFDVAADLDVDSIEHIPYVTHSSDASQDANADGLWNVSLSLNLFAEATDAFVDAADIYAVVKRWGDEPMAGVLPGVGGIESVEDQAAMGRVGGSVQMLNKWVTHYSGSFLLTVRKL